MRRLPSPARLSFYEEPPQVEVSVADLWECSLARLQLLRNFENCSMTTGSDKNDALQSFFSEHGAELDTISHFVLRLAFCGTREHRRWLAGCEASLFRRRVSRASASEVLELSSFAGTISQKVPPLQLRPVARRRRITSRATQMSSSAPPTKGLLAPFRPPRQVQSTRTEELNLDRVLDVEGYVDRVDSSDREPPWVESFRSSCFKMPFELAPPCLVSTMSCVLKGGFAYVPVSKLPEILEHHFRIHLDRSLDTTERLVKHVARDERLADVLKRLRQQHAHNSGRSATRRTFKAAGLRRPVILRELDSLVSRSMPLCMQHLFSELRQSHHLKYHGRVQLRLFLKGIGLSLEDSLSFWKSEFTRGGKMSAAEFKKEYAYNIRHHYGKEGRMKEGKPMGCDKILQLPPPKPGEFHGCPFKSWGEIKMRSYGAARGIRAPDLAAILRHSAAGEHQIACRAHFRAMHEGAPMKIPGVIPEQFQGHHHNHHHPNLYFEASDALHKTKLQGQEELLEDGDAEACE